MMGLVRLVQKEMKVLFFVCLSGYSFMYMLEESEECLKHTLCIENQGRNDLKGLTTYLTFESAGGQPAE